jgi:RNA polymerase sigma-70 factor (ECF subfamily)
MQNWVNYSEASDEDLVAMAREGNTNAFEELVVRHKDKLYGRAFSMLRNEEEAIDVTQDAWIKAWKRLAQFHGDSSFSTWITRIVINLCVDKLRKQKREQTESIEKIEEESGGVERFMEVIWPNPSEGLEKTELRSVIDKALAQLSNSHRAVLIMHEFQGMQYKEIAKAMGCSIGTVMSRLFYARRKMASLMSKLNNEENHEF